MAGKGICYFNIAKYKEEGVFHDTFYPACDRHFDLVQVLQFYCGKSGSHFFALSLAISQPLFLLEFLSSCFKRYPILWMSFVEMQRREAFWMYFYIFLFSRK